MVFGPVTPKKSKPNSNVISLVFFSASPSIDFVDTVEAIPHKITEAMNRTLTQSVSESEIQAALKEIGPTKAPGIDGMTAQFFQRYWATVGEDVVATMSTSNFQKPQVADEKDMDPTQYFKNRVKALAALKSAGINPYPHKFHVSMSIPEYIKTYKAMGEHLEDVDVSLA
ncbi:hypothetical protein Vadar_002692 [Vaccinium darrowii]|uniref:Uncharacterized protein n=1 Tax=Vaccinium darrowii TaxID=229202 RepID=A0ACB7XFF4_9ERIC|nr:hypothetical protein Vadar_002692 [Vaccinium darrowii]